MVCGEWIKQVVLNDLTQTAAFNARSLHSSARLTEHRPIWGVGLMLAWIRFYGDIFPKWLETTNAVCLVKMKTFCRPQIGCLWTVSWVWCTAETVSSAPQQETISVIHSDEDMFLLFFFFLTSVLCNIWTWKEPREKSCFQLNWLIYYKRFPATTIISTEYLQPCSLLAHIQRSFSFKYSNWERVKKVAGITLLAQWWTQHSLHTHQGIEDCKVMNSSRYNDNIPEM